MSQGNPYPMIHLWDAEDLAKVETNNWYLTVLANKGAYSGAELEAYMKRLGQVNEYVCRWQSVEGEDVCEPVTISATDPLMLKVWLDIHYVTPPDTVHQRTVTLWGIELPSTEEAQDAALPVFSVRLLREVSETEELILDVHAATLAEARAKGLQMVQDNPEEWESGWEHCEGSMNYESPEIDEDYTPPVTTPFDEPAAGEFQEQ